MTDRSDWIALKAAATKLRLGAEMTRKLAKNGQLVGEQRGGRNQWFIDPQSLANEIAERGGPWEGEVEKLADEVRRLVGKVAALETAGTGDPHEARAASQRDQYRAEAATMREVAIRANAAHRAAVGGFRQMLEAMEEQTNLVSELLGPRTPVDLGASGEAGGGR